MRADCEAFLSDNASDLDETGATAEQIGHDFWLTQRHHGVGFWDRGLGELGRRLTDAAETFNIEAYKGDDGLVYLGGYEHFEEQA